MSTNNSPSQSSRPDYVTDEHLKYLDDLRESGAINMLGVRPYLAKEFNLNREISHNILTYWMSSYGKEDR